MQFTTGQGPYGGTAAAVPGVVQAENYDTGGPGVGYSVNAVNGTANGYRPDGVDLEATADAGGGYNIGWTWPGQWFRYTVNVAAAGSYTLSLRVAAPNPVSGALHLTDASGANLTGSINIPGTGWWYGGGGAGCGAGGELRHRWAGGGLQRERGQRYGQRLPPGRGGSGGHGGCRRRLQHRLDLAGAVVPVHGQRGGGGQLHAEPAGGRAQPGERGAAPDRRVRGQSDRQHQHPRHRMVVRRRRCRVWCRRRTTTPVGRGWATA